jgi:hypothetical protein
MTRSRGTFESVTSFHDWVERFEDNFATRRICGCLGAPRVAECGARDDGDGARSDGRSPAADVADAHATPPPPSSAPAPVDSWRLDAWMAAAPMNETHGACARDRLGRMSLVLVTELLDAPLLAPLLRRRFGWHDDAATAAAASALAATAPDQPGQSAAIAARAGSRRGGGDAFARFTRDRPFVARLKGRHAHDLALYAHARAIMCRDLETEAALADADAEARAHSAV